MAIGENNMNFDTINPSDLTGATVPVATPVEGAKKGGNSDKIAEFQKLGFAAQANMSADEQATVKSKKDTLIFKGFAVLQSKMTESIARGKDNEGKVNRVKAPKVVGLVFQSTEDITVPLIDIRYNFTKAVPASEISERTIPANRPFILTKLEAMYLLARVEYSGYFTTESNGDGYMNVNTAKYQKENALPTPTFNLVEGGSHDMNVSIDTQVDGKWVIDTSIPDAERFASCLVKKVAQKGSTAGGAKKPKVDKPVVVAAALRQILSI